VIRLGLASVFERIVLAKPLSFRLSRRRVSRPDRWRPTL